MYLYDMITEEAEYKKPLSEHRFLELLHDRTRNSHDAGKKAPFYVTMDEKADFMLVTPSAKDEKSPFWADRLIQQLQHWKRYPSRNRCLKFYTGSHEQGDSTYVVFPWDGARIGICPAESFLRSFQLVKKDLDIDRLDNPALVKWLVTLVDGLNKLNPKLKLEIDRDELSDMHLGKFDSAMKQVSSAVKSEYLMLTRAMNKLEEDLPDGQHKILKDFLKRQLSCHKYLEEKLDPDANGFKFVRIESFDKQGTRRQAWTDAPCLLVRRDKYVEMHKKGDIK